MGIDDLLPSTNQHRQLQTILLCHRKLVRSKLRDKALLRLALQLLVQELLLEVHRFQDCELIIRPGSESSPHEEHRHLGRVHILLEGASARLNRTMPHLLVELGAHESQDSASTEIPVLSNPNQSHPLVNNVVRYHRQMHHLEMVIPCMVLTWYQTHQRS